MHPITAGELRAGDRIRDPNGSRTIVTVGKVIPDHLAEDGDVVYVSCTDRPAWAFTLPVSERVDLAP